MRREERGGKGEGEGREEGREGRGARGEGRGGEGEREGEGRGDRSDDESSDGQVLELGGDRGAGGCG